MSSLSTLRKALFYALLAVYLLSCPLVILYVLGYDIRPAGERTIVHSGDLYVASFPVGAALYVDGRSYPRPTPTSVLNLPPGMHRLGVRLPGYLPWTAPVRVLPGQTTLVNDILLIPKEWRQEALDSEAFEELLPFSTYPNLLLRKGSRLKDVFLFDLQQKSLLPLALPGSAYAQAEVLSWVPLMESSALLLEVELGSLRSRLLATIQSGGFRIQDVTELTPDGIDRVEWTATQPEELFYFSAESVTRIDVATETVYPGFLQELRGFGAQGQTLYLLSEDGTVLTWQRGAQKATTLPGFEGMAALFPEGGFVRLIPLKDASILFHGAGGRLVVGLQGGQLQIGAVSGFRVESDPTQLLLWRAGRLGTLTLSSPAAPPKDPTRPALQWIPLRQTSIEQAFFVLAGTHVLYRDADSVFLLSPGRGGEGEIYPVATVRRGTSVYYSDRDGSLYFIDPSTARPSRLEIVHRTQLVDQLLLELRKRF
jgi:hypothetical protein